MHTVTSQFFIVFVQKHHFKLCTKVLLKWKYCLFFFFYYGILWGPDAYFYFFYFFPIMEMHTVASQLFIFFSNDTSLKTWHQSAWKPFWICIVSCFYLLLWNTTRTWCIFWSTALQCDTGSQAYFGNGTKLTVLGKSTRFKIEHVACDWIV